MLVPTLWSTLVFVLLVTGSLGVALHPMQDSTTDKSSLHPRWHDRFHINEDSPVDADEVRQSR